MPDRNQIKDQVLAATDIVDLVGDHVALRPAGREFKGLCPFHDDRNPSMHVVPHKQIFHCFVCGAGGDAFTFAMKYHKLGFPEALEMLAQRAGIELPAYDASPQQQAARDDRKRIAEANERALRFFRRLLEHDEHGAVGRETLERRGVSAEMIEAFQLGVSANRWDGLVTLIHKNNWSIDDFRLAGLVKPRDDGSDYDALRHRLIFPICDSLGRPIAFGGRRLDEEDNPKYLNSPETALFHKSATLYGLHLAKKAIIDTRAAVLVEGYTDVIAAHQHGATNVVAALGTALTAQHVRELRRYCDRAILVMDGDAAGVKAADRALELFIAEGLDVAIAIIPDGQDPDELLKSDGGLEKWNALVENATDALAFAFERLAGGIDAADSATARQRVISDFLGRIAACGFASAHPDRQKWILDRLYRLTERNQTALRREILEKTPVSRAPERAPEPAPVAPPAMDQPPQPEPSDELSPFAHDDEAGAIDADDPFGGFEPASSLAPPPAWGKPHVVAEAEQTVVVGLIHEADRFGQTLPNGMSLDEALPPATFSDLAGRAVYQSVYDLLADGARPTLADLLAEMANAGRMEHAAWLTAAELSVAQRTDRKPDREEEMFQADLRFLFERYADAQRRNEADPRARLAALRDSAMTANDGLRRHTAIARAPDTPG